MLSILITLSLILIVYLAYILWIKPVRTMKFYARFLKSQGYNVYEIPYNPIKMYMLNCIQMGT